jgi:hypothetical protein
MLGIFRLIVPKELNRHFREKLELILCLPNFFEYSSEMVCSVISIGCSQYCRHLCWAVAPDGGREGH